MKKTTTTPTKPAPKKTLPRCRPNWTKLSSPPPVKADDYVGIIRLASEIGTARHNVANAVKKLGITPIRRPDPTYRNYSLAHIRRSEAAAVRAYYSAPRARKIELTRTAYS